MSGTISRISLLSMLVAVVTTACGEDRDFADSSGAGNGGSGGSSGKGGSGGSSGRTAGGAGVPNAGSAGTSVTAGGSAGSLDSAGGEAGDGQPEGGNSGGGAISSEGGGGGTDNGTGPQDGGAGGSPEEPNEPCTTDEAGAIRCAGNAARARLQCDGESWVDYDECAEDQRCDTRAESEGACAPVVSDCADKQPGEGVCKDLERFDCGPDLVTIENEETCTIFCVARVTGSECSACEDGQYSAEGTPDTCTEWSDCSVGEYVSTPGTGTTDRACDDCGTGSYSNTANAASCTDWTDCEQGTYISGAGSTTTDRQCSACTTGFTSAENQGSCTAWATCPTGTYVSTEGTPSANRACSPCPSGSLSTTTNAPSCTPWNLCSWAGGGTVTPGTTTTHPVCSTSPTQYRQWGTNSHDYGYDIALDSAGNVYVVGENQAVSGSTTLAYLRKYDSSGYTAGSWTEQFGTTQGTRSNAVAVDGSGNRYVVGYTGGTLGDGTFGSTDAYVRRYNANSNTSAWTAQFGTAEAEYANEVAVDSSGNVYVTGYTTGQFPGNTKAGTTDVFIAKFGPSGGDPAWVKQYSAGICQGLAIAVHPTNGQIYVASVWNSDIDVRSFTSSGAAGTFTATISSAGVEVPMDMTFRSNGDLLVAGFTSGNLDGTNRGSDDAFVRKYPASGAVVTKQWGTVEREYATGVAVSPNGTVWVSGWTDGNIGGTNQGPADAFVQQLTSGLGLGAPTQFGFAGSDTANAVAVDAAENVYLTGGTEGSFPGFTNAGRSDAYVRQIPFN